MRALMNAYRWLVILIAVGLVILCAIPLGIWLTPGLVWSGSPLFLAIAVVSLLAFILSIGVVAAVICIHDRLAEVADEFRLIRITLEERL